MGAVIVYVVSGTVAAGAVTPVDKVTPYRRLTHRDRGRSAVDRGDADDPHWLADHRGAARSHRRFRS